MVGTRRGIYVAIRIAAPIDAVWLLTQDPEQHARWDLRFSAIAPIETLTDGGQRFRYERRLPGHIIRGLGTSIGETRHPDGSSTSALRFDTADRLSPLRAGRGYWRYLPDGDGTVFITGYDYRPGWGRLLDVIVRPLIGWATAWSFDRLRIWIERGQPPERWPLRSALQVWRHERPRAGRCDRRAPERDVFAAAPATLATLEAP